MFKFKNRLILIPLTLLSSCTQKIAELIHSNGNENKIELASKKETLPAKKKDSNFSKVLRESIYFSSNLEREALKLISKNTSLQKMTLFSILSYIVETKSGVKKSTPYGLDCGKFDVQSEQKIIKISKICTKPGIEIIKIKTLEEDSLYEIEFMTKEWERVVGMSVTLTGENMLCQLKVKEKKLYRLKCDNWSYQMDSGQTSLTVMKANEFLFQRDSQKQFVIRGGFFKDLMENKKFDISVPMQGKIKIFEKEIKVIDQYSDEMNGVQQGETLNGLNKSNQIKNEIKGVKNEAVEGQKETKKDSEKESQESVNQVSPENQEVNPEAQASEGNIENKQEASQNETSNQVQTEENSGQENQNEHESKKSNPTEGEIDFGAEATQQPIPTAPTTRPQGRSRRR